MTIDDFESRIYEIHCHLKKMKKKFGGFIFLLYLCIRKNRDYQNSVNKKEYKIKTIIS